MLYRIGTEKEITEEIIRRLPEEVTRELLRSTIMQRKRKSKQAVSLSPEMANRWIEATSGHR